MDSQPNIFSESELKKMLAPLDHAYAPPAAYYTSKEFTKGKFGRFSTKTGYGSAGRTS